MVKLAHMTDKELISVLDKLGRECSVYAAISSQFNKRKDVENRRLFIAEEAFKRGLIGMKSKRKYRNVF